MQDSFGNRKTLVRIQVNRPALKVDQQLPVKHEKEFIVVVMLMPMILSPNDANPHYTVVHSGEGLIEPLIFTFPNNSWNIDYLEVLELNVKLSYIGKMFRHSFS